ncbi:OmpA family protein [Skermania sp. ID1734]|uniref:channel-forming protein ArfA/OmpATb n=1 Tax=Skermania sp. ID1734 TaxID=2597516 RepID=UPI00163DDC4E|nr:OmpA family protein [Skermania sp. ID1734]
MTNAGPDPAAPEPREPARRRTTITRYSSRMLWLPLLLAAIIVPLILAALATFSPIGVRDHVESQLTDKSKQALAAAGFPQGQVSFDGRDATITNVPRGRAAAAVDAVAHVDGVRNAQVQTGTKAAPVDIALTGNQILLIGAVPDQAERDALVAAAQHNASGREVVDRLAVSPDAAPTAGAGPIGEIVAAMSGPGDRSIRIGANTMTLTGTVGSDQEKATIADKIHQVLPDSTVDNQLAVTAGQAPAPSKPAAAAPAPPATPPPPPPAAGYDKAALQKQINDAIAGGAISFQPDTATLTASGNAAVQRVADILRATPAARIEVDGFVADTGGSESEAKSLSEQRAVAVKDRLASMGIDPNRMTALGFGTSRPIAPNNTAAGLAANRRVEIVVL